MVRPSTARPVATIALPMASASRTLSRVTVRIQAERAGEDQPAVLPLTGHAGPEKLYVDAVLDLDGPDAGNQGPEPLGVERGHGKVDGHPGTVTSFDSFDLPRLTIE